MFKDTTSQRIICLYINIIWYIVLVILLVIGLLNGLTSSINGGTIDYIVSQMMLGCMKSDQKRWPHLLVQLCSLWFLWLLVFCLPFLSLYNLEHQVNLKSSEFSFILLLIYWRIPLLGLFLLYVLFSGYMLLQYRVIGYHPLHRFLDFFRLLLLSIFYAVSSENQMLSCRRKFSFNIFALVYQAILQFFIDFGEMVLHDADPSLKTFFRSCLSR